MAREETSLRRWNLRACALAAAICLAATSGAEAVTVVAAPSADPVGVGAGFDVVVSVSGLAPGAPSLGAFSLDLGYDPGLLSYGGVTYGPGLDLGVLGSFRVDDGSNPGSVAVDEISFEVAADLDLLQPDAFVLFTVSFTALTQGTSALTLASPGGFADAQGLLLPATLLGSSVTVVPEPATLLLVGFAFVGLAAARRAQAR